MAIPDYQSLMLPLLETLGDTQEHKIRDIRNLLADHFGLTLEERSLQSQNTLFNKRVSWANSSLKNAGLVDNSTSGIMKITQNGLEVLNQHPIQIDNDFLSKFPGFVIFNKGRISSGPEEGDPKIELTPYELLEKSYQIIRDQLANDLLEQVFASSPVFFEKMVIDLLLAMGYGGSRKDAGEAIGRSNDEGVDGIIKEDKLGLDVIYIQAKRWKNPVGRQEIQGFVGSLEGKKARKGIFITTSQFTKTSIEYVKSIEKKVILIDGIQLSQFMIDYGVGVTDLNTYIIKRIDSDYFIEE
ncbi:restriction endonuclease [Methanosphaerula palustris]|uniref:Restriction endonuclease n=1 Tax=Methanosphaerula palustris (strain ATCC BAA-1556 / DSM 19958 / E1-9c) TaxID=521011 RepID=B8GIV8_METPE|nr:restriction endonuclease [Methanosphaerula palustris]ACL16921.1 restriction endonuclease [Methanosphaerula palustris E1-9c]